MKWMTAFLVIFLSASANAALITYEYDSILFQHPPTDPHPYGINRPRGYVTFDTEAVALTEFSISFGDKDFLWQGVNPLIFEPSGYFGYINAEQSVISLSPGIFEVGIVWEYDTGNGFAAGQEVLENFPNAWTEETMPYLNWVEKGYGFELYMHSYRRVEPSRIPEPATLSLLALGLAAIGIRRRLR